MRRHSKTYLCIILLLVTSVSIVWGIQLERIIKVETPIFPLQKFIPELGTVVNKSRKFKPASKTDVLTSRWWTKPEVSDFSDASIAVFRYQSRITAIVNYKTYHTYLPFEIYRPERVQCLSFSGNACMMACAYPNADGHCLVVARYGSDIVTFRLGRRYLDQEDILQNIWREIDLFLVSKE